MPVLFESCARFNKALLCAYDKINQVRSWNHMNQSRILPFYMAYPLPMYYQEEDTVTRDLEYLQQMYPSEAKRYQKIIAEILNQIDYEGSCIYDEYPDKVLLYRAAAGIYDKAVPVQETERRDRGRDRDLMDVIQVLMYDEIHRRRGRRRRCCRKWW